MLNVSIIYYTRDTYESKEKLILKYFKNSYFFTFDNVYHGNIGIETRFIHDKLDQ